MKRFNMKNSVLSPWKGTALIGSMAISLLFTACGDDITNNEVLKAESYTTKEDLPDCGEKYEGKFATIPSKGEVYVCADGKWNSLLNKATISGDGDFACSTVELSSKKGYKVVCGGDSVAVLTNGAKGETGDKGPVGSAGDPGEDGTPGTSGSNGRDLSLKEGDCAIMNYGSDYVVYDCGDSVYVKNMSGYKANLKTWNALKPTANLQDLNGNEISEGITTKHLRSPSEKSVATFDRVIDHTWENTSASEEYNLLGNRDFRNHAIKGKADIEVLKDAKANSYGLEPMVAVEINLTGWPDASEWGGFCLTYEAEKDMELIIGVKDHFARVPLKASAKETSVDILSNTFKPDDENDKLEVILNNGMKYIIIKVAGNLEPGKYENSFALYEIGAYGRCGGPTVNKIKAEVLNKVGAKGSFTDDRNDYTYNTVTIDGDVWMAENLRVPYTFNKIDKFGDDAAEVLDGEGNPIPVNLSYCNADVALCDEYGPLYTWAAAMDSMGLYNDASVYQDEDGKEVAGRRCGYNMTCALTTPVKGICPEGWHLPSAKEFEKLFKAAGYDEAVSGTRYVAGRALGILPSEPDNSNWLGFNATASGYFTTSEQSVGELAYMWHANDLDDEYVDVFYSGYNATIERWGVGIMSGSFEKSYFAPVRCVQDKAKE